MRLTPPGTPGDGLPPHAPRGRRAQDMVSSQMLAEIQHSLLTQTEAIARIAGGIRNNVLESATYTFDASGVIQGRYKVAAGSMDVDNLSAANPMVLVPRADAGGTPPSQGIGMRVIPKSSYRPSIPLDSHEWTLYGTQGDQVSLAVYTSPPKPSNTLA